MLLTPAEGVECFQINSKKAFLSMRVQDFSPSLYVCFMLNKKKSVRLISFIFKKVVANLNRNKRSNAPHSVYEASRHRKCPTRYDIPRMSVVRLSLCSENCHIFLKGCAKTLFEKYVCRFLDTTKLEKIS